MRTLRDSLRTIVALRSSDVAVEWLDAAASASRLSALPASYTAMSRKVGRAPLALTDVEGRELAEATPGVEFGRWTVDDLGRALLLALLADAVDADMFRAAAVDCYEQGDAREQQSWLKSLPLLPQPERFLSYAIDACRTNILPVFEAIACDNPYPERFFPELHFNQLVLKALFVGAPLERIVGLQRRRNSELSRMAQDYAAERRAAGRTIPSDLHMALTDD